VKKIYSALLISAEGDGYPQRFFKCFFAFSLLINDLTFHFEN